MTKNHLKRLSVPKQWGIPRKSTKLIVRPYGYLKTAMPLAVLLKEVLKLANTRKEIRHILTSKNVELDGKVVYDDKLPVGIMSVLTIKEVGSYRMLLNTKGILQLKKIDAKSAMIKLCKVITKNTIAKKKTQLGFHDGRTIIYDGECNTSDTIAFTLPQFKIKSHLKMQKKATVLMIGGANIGSIGTVENVGINVTVKIGDKIIETDKKNTMVIGDAQPLIEVN